MKPLFYSTFLALFLIAGCCSTQNITLPNYSTSIKFYENSTGYYAGNKLMKCRLSDTAKLNAYTCISWVHFFENGQLKQIETAVDIKKWNFVIPSHSVIFFDEEIPDKIKEIWFSKNVNINGVVCKGKGKISTTFYKNDSLKACFIAKDQIIQGFPCKSSPFKPVYFYPSGKIKTLTLSVDYKTINATYQAGETISVKENGDIHLVRN